MESAAGVSKPMFHEFASIRLESCYIVYTDINKGSLIFSMNLCLCDISIKLTVCAVQLIRQSWFGEDNSGMEYESDVELQSEVLQ